MTFNLMIDKVNGMWAVINYQSGNDWHVSFDNYEDAYKFLMDLVIKTGVNQ